MLKKQISEIRKYTVSEELALGYLRYEALRKLNCREFQELCERNLKGEIFDVMVDDLVIKQ